MMNAYTGLMDHCQMKGEASHLSTIMNVDDIALKL
jgi:hypothetical protein